VTLIFSSGAFVIFFPDRMYSSLLSLLLIPFEDTLFLSQSFSLASHFDPSESLCCGDLLLLTRFHSPKKGFFKSQPLSLAVVTVR